MTAYSKLPIPDIFFYSPFPSTTGFVSSTLISLNLVGLFYYFNSSTSTVNLLPFTSYVYFSSSPFYFENYFIGTPFNLLTCDSMNLFPYSFSFFYYSLYVTVVFYGFFYSVELTIVVSVVTVVPVSVVPSSVGVGVGVGVVVVEFAVVSTAGVVGVAIVV